MQEVWNLEFLTPSLDSLYSQQELSTEEIMAMAGSEVTDLILT